MRVKKLFLLFCFFCGTLLLVQADELNKLAERGDAQAIENLLTSASPEDAPQLEAQTLEHAREAVRSGDLSRAKALAEAVLLANIDNQEAADLYLSIEEAQQQQAIRQEQAEQAEQARQIQRQQEEQEAYYASLRQVSSDNFSLMVALAPLHYSQYYTVHPSRQHMLGADAAAVFRFTHPLFSAGVGAHYQHGYYSISESQLSNDFGFSIWLGSPLYIASALNPETPSIKLPLHLRMSYRYITHRTQANDAENASPLLDFFLTPGIGLYIDRMDFEVLYVSAGFDWLPLSIIQPVINNAFSYDIEIDIPLLTIHPGVDLHIQPRVHGYMLSTSEGREFAYTPSLAIGAKLYVDSE